MRRDRKGRFVKEESVEDCEWTDNNGNDWIIDPNGKASPAWNPGLRFWEKEYFERQMAGLPEED